MRLADHRRTIRLVVFLLGITGVVLAFRQALAESRGQVLPDLPAFLIGGVLTLSGIVMSARAWTGMFHSGHDRRALAGSLYASQLTKYLPAGGFVQAAGQVSMSVTAGARPGLAATAAATWAFVSVVAGSVVSAGLVFAESLPTWARALSLCGLLTPALLHRRVLAAALHRVHRIIRRVPDPDVLPSQRRVLGALGWSLGNAVAGSATYAVLLGSLDGDTGFVTVLSAFSLSWVVGFLVFPLPSGIGVREAVLVAVVPNASSAALLGASLAQRLLVLMSEVVLTVGNQVLVRRQRRAHRATNAPDAMTTGDGAAGAGRGQAPPGDHPAPDAGAGDGAGDLRTSAAGDTG